MEFELKYYIKLLTHIYAFHVELRFNFYTLQELVIIY